MTHDRDEPFAGTSRQNTSSGLSRRTFSPRPCAALGTVDGSACPPPPKLRNVRMSTVLERSLPPSPRGPRQPPSPRGHGRCGRARHCPALGEYAPCRGEAAENGVDRCVAAPANAANRRPLRASVEVLQGEEHGGVDRREQGSGGDAEVLEACLTTGRHAFHVEGKPHNTATCGRRGVVLAAEERRDCTPLLPPPPGPDCPSPPMRTAGRGGASGQPPCSCARYGWPHAHRGDVEGAGHATGPDRVVGARGSFTC